MKYLEIWQGDKAIASIEKRIYKAEIQERVPRRAVDDILKTVSCCLGTEMIGWTVKKH